MQENPEATAAMQQETELLPLKRHSRQKTRKDSDY